MTVAMRLELRHRYTHRVLSERETLVLQSGALQGPFVPEEGPGPFAMAVYESDPETGELSRKRSDLLMRPRRSEHEWIAIEVELTPPTKSGELLGQCIGWRDCESVGQTIYYTAPNVTASVELAMAQALAGAAPSTGLEAIETLTYESSEPASKPTGSLSLVELPVTQVPRERRRKTTSWHLSHARRSTTRRSARR